MTIFFRSAISLIIFSAGMLGFQTISFADDQSRNKEIAERFAKCDTNHDGKLTLTEAKGCMPRVYDHFGVIDSGNKGFVTIPEIQAMADRR